MNRYNQLAFSSLRDVNHLSLPYEQLDELLSNSQQRKVLVDQVSNLAPKYIQESKYATDAAKQLAQYQQGIKDQLAQVAAKGNTKDYFNALDQAQQEITKLYKPGGLAYNLNEDYATYAAHVAKEQERLAKGEIEPEQYQTSVTNPLQEYDQATGTKRYNPTLKPKAVNADEFANDFVKNYQDNKYNKGDLQIINGRVFYKNTEVSGVDAQRILNGLSAAYKNAAMRTGQLEDIFNVRNKNGDIINQYRASSLGEAQQTLDLINSTDLKSKEQVKKLQTQLNKFGLDTGGLDGEVGPKTQAAIDVAKRNATDIMTNLPNMKDADLFPKVKNKFMDSYVNQLMSPYADAASRRKEEIKFTDMEETEARFRREEDYKSKLKKEEDAMKSAIVPIMPASKAVPKDVKYYVKDGKLKQNTNASADAWREKGETFSTAGGAYGGIGLAYKIGAFFDRLFTSNDTADFSDPTLNNIREHMTLNIPGFENMSETQQMEMVAQEIDKQAKQSIGGNFTANPDSKLKENTDKIFGAVKYDSDGNLQYDPGLLPNFKVNTREGKVLGGQQFLDQVKDGKFGDKAGISYKGTIDDWTSPLPYGTTIMGVGNTEVHIEPDVASTQRPEAWANGLWRAKSNAEIGNTSHFKYFGNDYTAIYKPDGTYQVKQDGTNTWETVIEEVDPNTGQTNFSKVKK